MNRELKSLALRRAQLVSDCAQQREDLAAQVASLRAPSGSAAVGGLLAGLGPVAGLLAGLGPAKDWLARHGKLRLALAGAALGLAVTRRRQLLSIATAGFSLWRTVRGALPLLLSR